MIRTLPWAVAGLLAACPAPAVAADYSIKPVKEAPPKELQEPVRQLLGDEAFQLLDGKGGVVCQVWFRKEVPAKGTDAQIKNGLTYRDNLTETTLLGAIQFVQQGSDYRKQKIKPGVYTLRLAFQPMDGDHMGTAPYPDFCLLSPAAEDKDPKTMDAKELHELSRKASGTSHPAILLLYPNEQPKDKPELASKEGDALALTVKATAIVGGKKAPLGIALTLVGASAGA